jgi:hypothetical protein
MNHDRAQRLQIESVSTTLHDVPLVHPHVASVACLACPTVYHPEPR